MKVTAEIEVPLNAQTLAQAFCQMNDEEQAQFFIEAAAIGATWKASERGLLGADWQWWSVGRHLKNCACSTPEALDMITTIAEGAKADL